MVLRKADINLTKQKDCKDGKYSQVLPNGLDNKLRKDLDCVKKIRAHQGLRHFWGLHVHSQHPKTTRSTNFSIFPDQVVAYVIPSEDPKRSCVTLHPTECVGSVIVTVSLNVVVVNIVVIVNQ
ncbi:hypothetical protein E2320_002171 [Naja naja]|nr:hypothetical protein E2320_002171 [Naja naja]